MSALTSLRDRANAGVAWSAVHIWGTHAMQLGVMLVLARLLEPAEFGLFAMAQVVLALTQSLAGQGIPEALVQAERSEDTAWSTGLRAVGAGSVVTALAIILAAPLLARLFSTPELRLLLTWMAPAVVLYGVHSILYARIRRQLLFGAHAGAGVAGAVVSFLVGVPAAATGLGVWALVLSAYAGQIVETALLARASGGIPTGAFDGSEYRRLLRFGRFIVAGDLATFLNRRTDDYFVGAVLGPEALGYYSVGYRLLELVTTVALRAVERVAFPVLSKLQRAPELMADALHTTFRFTSMAAFPAFVGLVLVGPDLVTVALGPNWAPAAAPLQILAVGGLALCAANVLPSAIRAAGYPQWNVTISVVKGLLLTVAFAWAARSGLEAVALVFTIGMYAVFPLFYIAVRKVVPLSLGAYLKEGLAPLAASAVMAMGLLVGESLLAPLPAPGRLATMIGLGGALYVGSLLVLARGHVRELRQRFDTLRRSRREGSA